MENKKLALEKLNRVDAEGFREASKRPVCFILDNIRSMHNVGSVFRSADAFAIQKIYLCGITAQPPHREIEKTALGATESVEWEYCTDVISLIRKLKIGGYEIVSLEQVENKIFLQDFMPKIDKKYAFILGNEVFGVSQVAVDHSDIVIEIPQFGTKHSLNVSVSAGILIWDYFMKTKGKSFLKDHCSSDL